MRDGTSGVGPRLDLRAFRLQLSPRRSLGQVARGAQVDLALLSRIERGTRAITAGCARLLAGYYSRITGTCITAGEVFDMAERAAERRAGNEISLPGR